MALLAESKHYIVYHEYESVIMEIKGTNREIQIGDFYGDPQMAIISDDEKFCVICGCGLIIYYLREPFREYKYDMLSEQWKEWGRDEKVVWIESIKLVSGEIVEAVTEDGKKIRISV